MDIIENVNLECSDSDNEYQRNQSVPAQTHKKKEFWYYLASRCGSVDKTTVS